MHAYQVVYLNEEKLPAASGFKRISPGGATTHLSKSNEKQLS